MLGFPVFRLSATMPVMRSRLCPVVGSAEMVLSIRVDEDSEVTDGALENEPRDLSPRVPLLKE
jgi:hypothetical protein